MIYSDIYTRLPINQTAKNVISQANAMPDKELSRDELVHILDLLKRKHKLLKSILGIKSRAAHKNMMYRYNKFSRKVGGAKQPRALAEYVRIGIEIQRMQNIVVGRNAEWRIPFLEKASQNLP